MLTRVRAVLDDIVAALQAMGIGVDNWHAEFSAGQFELSIKPTGPLQVHTGIGLSPAESCCTVLKAFDLHLLLAARCQHAMHSLFAAALRPPHGMGSPVLSLDFTCLL